ncbi:uncharacterized protein LOC144107788 isoform X2 [Amblyomma americanum]
MHGSTKYANKEGSGDSLLRNFTVHHELTAVKPLCLDMFGCIHCSCTSSVTSGDIEGFVDLGSHTPADQKNVLADHGMIVLFQPFTGKWTQILGVFASKGNVKAPTLAKIILETTVLAEKAGLFVDCITCDGASWNKSMWRLFGIQGSPSHVRSSTKHPVDPKGSSIFCQIFHTF